jgi:hypothetical protein
LLEITRPPIDQLSPADSPHPIARPAKPVGISGRHPPPGLLVGGVVVAMLAATTVWFWPAASIPEPTPPPRYSLSPPEAAVERTAGDEAAEAPGGDSVGSVLPAESLVPDRDLAEPAVGLTGAEALDLNPARDNGEAESPAEADDATARILTDSADEETTAATPSRAAAEPAASRRPPARDATAQSRPRQPSQGKTELRPIVITPPEWLEQSRARPSRDPWQPPTDTGFNQK